MDKIKLTPKRGNLADGRQAFHHYLRAHLTSHAHESQQAVEFLLLQVQWVSWKVALSSVLAGVLALLGKHCWQGKQGR